jgi:hypothetical protein
MNTKLASFTIAILTGLTAFAGVPRGQVFSFLSPEGLTEQCIKTEQMPGAVYSAKDLKQETKLCGLNLYSAQIALCAKTWGTSPALVIIPNTTGMLAEDFEAKNCLKGDEPKGTEIPAEKAAKIKFSMNDATTSATYSRASFLYYHLSRYFEVSIDVPVSVYRSMDKNVHYERITSKVIDNGKKNGAAWKIFSQAEKDPMSYKPASELFTDDRKQIFGALLDGGGDKYTTDFNGLRSKWGLTQTKEFMDTAPFQALRSHLELKDAIVMGEKLARSNEVMNKDLGKVISSQQMITWMKELSEITLLDHILNQQDRVGNIHYKWHWQWVQDGEVKTLKADLKDQPRPNVIGKVSPPAEIASYFPILVQKTRLVDNDAGVRTNYKNFGKIAGHLASLRHFNAKIYQKLMALDRDIKAKGAIYNYVVNTFNLTKEEVALLATNTADAASILRNSCKAGQLKFDLKPEKFMLGQNTLESISCE